MLKIGDIVLYTLTKQDCEDINNNSRQRANPHTPGQQIPVIVVWPHNDDMFNGQGFLDGVGTLWLTSIPHDGTGRPGTWMYQSYSQDITI